MAQNLLRASLLSESRVMREALEQRQRAAVAAFDQVRILTADNATQQTRIATVNELLRAWQDIAARETRLGDDPATRPQAIAMEKDGAGTPRIASGAPATMDERGAPCCIIHCGCQARTRHPRT